MHPGQQIIDIVLPTYRMEPEEHERFYPSVAKSMADRVLGEELNGQTYDEEEAKIWSLNISDKVREAVYGEEQSSELLHPSYYYSTFPVEISTVFP